MAGDIPGRNDDRGMTIQGISNVDFTTRTPVNIGADPTTRELLVKASFSGTGTGDVNIKQVGGATFSLGQQLAAASLPVVLTAAQISTLTPLSSVAVTQSTSPWASSLTDGTNTANMLKGDATYTGQVSQLTAGAYREITFTTTIAAAVASSEVANYKWVSVHIVTQGGSSTITFQGSNDNSNWVSVQLQDTTNAQNVVTVSSTAASKIFYGPLSYRYFRLNVSGIVSGTTAGVVELFANPSAFASFGVAAAQQGTWTVQPGNTPNTTAWLMTQKNATATLANVASSASSVTLLASNANRTGATIVNDSSAVLYVKFGSAASTSSYTAVMAGNAAAPFAYYEVPFGYTGIITGIWASATGNARLTEMTQ